MRVISVLIGSAVLASCTAGPWPAPTRTAEKQHEYEMLVAGKVAQAPTSCLPYYRNGDMRVIDDATIAFRDGTNRTYVNHMQGPCNGIGAGHYALVTTRHGTTARCRCDIADVVDTLTRMQVGSCVFGDFAPYVAPGRG